MDIYILDLIQNLKTPFLDVFFRTYSALGNHGEIWILLIVLLFLKRKTRKIAIYAAIALLIELVSVELIIKPIVARSRPYMVVAHYELISKQPIGYSFPSGHSASSFAIAYLLYLDNLKHKYLYLILASIMAFSRLYLTVHYPSDVLAGIIWGILVAKFTYKIYQKRNENMVNLQ